MATGFSVMDALNKNSKAGIEETPKARFRTKDISIFKMYRNEMNFYSIAAVEELAGDILTFGLKQNLELVYEPCEKGEYRIVAGERRWLALKHLVSKGYKEFEMATSKLTTPQDADEEQVEIIIANAYRNKSVADMIEEACCPVFPSFIVFISLWESSPDSLNLSSASCCSCFDIPDSS